MSEQDEKRERIIEHLLRKDGRGKRAGIYAVEYCQGCGEPVYTSCFIDAMMLHRHVNGKSECVHPTCHEKTVAVGQDEEGVTKTVRAIELQPYRFCELCGVRISIRVGKNSEVKTWACVDCEPKLADPDYLNRLRRRRYLDARYPTLEQIQVFDIHQESERLVMQETINPALKANHAERAKAALDELSKVHGENYRQGGE
jgi:hypothetical protein